ncbi:MAG: hypothetical protein D6704_09430 [Nitrospirae bacterium]|nr:MAG: hypothetical protein D6704_09430 [Nitrospirota bacterium]
MSQFIWATWQLYRRALIAAWASLTRSWVMIVGVLVYALLLTVIASVASGLGILGGLLVGFANAFFVGSVLSLLEQAVLSLRPMRWQDLWEQAGHYFWDVVAIGFLLWVPLQVLEMGMQRNPYGPAIISGVFLLMFILLNPVPEVIYQVRHASPLDVLKESYEFVVENWIEWFLPLAIVLAPFGFSFFLMLTSQGGRMAGLDLIQLLTIPFHILTNWVLLLGVPESVATVLVFLLTPIGTIFMLCFRGHLFAALHGSSRRQRLFRAQSVWK